MKKTSKAAWAGRFLLAFGWFISRVWGIPALLIVAWLLWGPRAAIGVLDANLWLIQSWAMLVPGWMGHVLQLGLAFLGTVTGGIQWLGAQPEKFLPPALNFGAAATAFLEFVVLMVPLLAEIMVLRLFVGAVRLGRRKQARRRERVYIKTLQAENVRLRGMVAAQS